MLIIITRDDNNTDVEVHDTGQSYNLNVQSYPVEQFMFQRKDNRYEFYPITGQLGSAPTTSKQPKASYPAEHTIVYDNRTFENPDPT